MNERSRGFDALKGIACIAVVFMHCEFPGTAGTVIQCLTRWSVPLFFAVSGFFYRKSGAGYALKKAKHILFITIWATLFYVLFEIVLHLVAGDLASYFASEVSAVNVAAWAVFNSPLFVNGHLWFLFALLYVYLFQAIVEHFNLTKYEPQLCVILLIAHFVLAYGFYLLGHPLQSGFYRNFLFEGIPFFYLGKLMRKYGTGKIQTINHVSRKALIVLVCGVGLSVVERWVIGRDFSVHIASVIVLIALLALAANGSLEKAPRVLSNLGKNDSMMVYILHPAIYLTMDQVVSISLQGTVYFWIRPILTLAISIGLAVLIDQFRNKVLVRK